MARTGVNLLVLFTISSSPLAFFFQCSLWFLEHKHCPLGPMGWMLFSGLCPLADDWLAIFWQGWAKVFNSIPNFFQVKFSGFRDNPASILWRCSKTGNHIVCSRWFNKRTQQTQQCFAVLSIACLVDSDIEWARYLPNRSEQSISIWPEDNVVYLYR